MTRRSTPVDAMRSSTVKDGDLSTPMELREFLEQLGPIMRLPPKTTVAMTAVRETLPVRPPARWVLPLAALMSLGTWGALSVRPTPVAIVPGPVVGTWVTHEPRYAGRSLELSPREVATTWPGGREVTMVHEVRATVRADTLVLVIRHGDGAAPQELALSFVPGRQESLVLRHPAGIRWVRQSAAPNAGEVMTGSADGSSRR